MIIYLHGFGSNGNAFKARLIRRIYPEIELLSPNLPAEPDRAIAIVEQLIIGRSNENKCLIVGSSLGGFYALHLHIKLKTSAVLLNPTIHPAHDLARRIQDDPNFSPQAINRWCDSYLKQLEKYFHNPEQIQKEKLHVYLNRDDEILDYRIARQYFRKSGCRLILNDAGGHVFLNFTKVLPEIINLHDQL